MVVPIALAQLVGTGEARLAQSAPTRPQGMVLERLEKVVLKALAALPVVRSATPGVEKMAVLDRVVTLAAPAETTVVQVAAATTVVAGLPTVLVALAEVATPTQASVQMLLTSRDTILPTDM